MPTARGARRRVAAQRAGSSLGEERDAPVWRANCALAPKMELNNPAARLHHFLLLCKKHHKESADRPMLMGWRKVFRMIDSVPDFTVMERVGRVWSLCPQTVEVVERYPELAPQLYLGWYEELAEAFLEVHARAPFTKFVDRIPKTLMVNLEFCANALAERCADRVVAEEALVELNKQTHELFRAIRTENDLDSAGQRYLLDCVGLIKHALEDYSLRGSPGLQQALDASTGALVSQRNIAIPMRETPLGKRFWELVNKISLALMPPDAQDGEPDNGTKANSSRRPRLHVPTNTRNGQPSPKTAKLLQL